MNPTITSGKYKVYTGIGAIKSAVTEAGVLHSKLWVCFIYKRDDDHSMKEIATGYIVGKRRPKGHQLIVDGIIIIVGDEI